VLKMKVVTRGGGIRRQVERSRGGRTSDGGGRGKDEMNVEGDGDGKWGDVTHPRSTGFTKEGGGETPKKGEEKDIDGGEGSEVSVETVCTEK
jgi:hypothetical protein